MASKARRFAAVFVWAFGFWLLLTWTVPAEQLIFGACLAALVALAMAPLGDVAAPWAVLKPRRLAAVAVLFGASLGRIVRANMSLARRILLPSRPLRSGMIIVPTKARTDGELAATGLITSLIVDNQIVDLDRSERELQYHAVAVPEGDRAAEVNAPTERLVHEVAR